MVRGSKIAISLGEDLLQEVERERRTSGETRSEFFRRAAQDLLRRERDREAVEQYVQGYLRDPETDDEVRWVEATSQAALAAYPYDDEDKE